MSAFPSGTGVRFDPQSAQIIADTVNGIRQQSGRAQPQSPSHGNSIEPFWAVLTASNTSNGSTGYTWHYANQAGGILSDAGWGDSNYSAGEINKNIAPEGAYVRLFFTGFNASNASTYLFSYGGAGLSIVVPSTSMGKGVYEGLTYTGLATGYNSTSGSLIGPISGTGCIIINGPEFGSTASEPYLGNAALGQGFGPLPGMPIGTDSVTNLPMFLVSAAGFGC